MVKQVPETWPTLSKWREAITFALSRGLSVDGKPVRAFSTPTGKVSGPCAIVMPSQRSSYLDEADRERTFCTHIAAFGLLLIGGPPEKEASWLRLDEWIETLGSSLLLTADELKPLGGIPPKLIRVDGPSNVEIGGTTYLGAVAELRAEIHFSEET